MMNFQLLSLLLLLVLAQTHNPHLCTLRLGGSVNLVLEVCSQVSDMEETNRDKCFNKDV